LFLNQLLTLYQQATCAVFLSHLMRLVQVPAPEIDATETDSAEPNPTEEGGDSATPRKLAYAASRLFTFQLIAMRYRSFSF
jgi:hypothetical protein